MKKIKTFKILWRYLKIEKLRLFLYIMLVMLSYLPALLSAFFWGRAVEFLVIKDIKGFIINLSIWEGIYVVFYSLLQIPRDALYTYLEIKFSKQVSKDLYEKIDKLPSIAFEDIGVGEFIYFFI